MSGRGPEETQPKLQQSPLIAVTQAELDSSALSCDGGGGSVVYQETSETKCPGISLAAGPIGTLGLYTPTAGPRKKTINSIVCMNSLTLLVRE